MVCPEIIYPEKTETDPEGCIYITVLIIYSKTVAINLRAKYDMSCREGTWEELKSGKGRGNDVIIF